ncbi:hypothetical protein [Flexilinea flocculi]|uniref:Alpha-L-arabinofuranosidase n=1 Tax=Flexilinea flocculi TaxID=1678840 RepID=A0A0K8PBM5_9CHLR|nr:hypothetical protein [Flexilinea flocculi]GAP39919.1 alpha-L-arabinofuranosidase [Flexilinea flocculi]
MKNTTRSMNSFEISVENFNEIQIQNFLFQLTIYAQCVRSNGKLMKSFLQREGIDILDLNQNSLKWELHQTIRIRTLEKISPDDDIKVEIETEEAGRLVIQNQSIVQEIPKTSHMRKLSDLWKKNFSADFIADAMDICGQQQDFQFGYAFQIDESAKTISQWMDLETGKIHEWVIPIIKDLHPKTLRYRWNPANEDPLHKTAFLNFLRICSEIEASPHIIMPLAQKESLNLSGTIQEVQEAISSKPWWIPQRIWEISCTGFDSQTSTEKINLLRETAERIKSIDPDSTLILPGSDPMFSDGRQWNEKLFESCNEWMDQIGVSNIFPGPKGWDGAEDNISFDQVCGLSQEFEAWIKRISNQLGTVDLHKTVRIAISPWSYFKQPALQKSFYDSSYEKQDAFYFQSVNNIIRKLSSRLGIVETGFLFGPMGMIESDQGKHWKTVPYVLFSMNRSLQNLILKTKTIPGKEIPSFRWAGIPGIAEEHTIPYLDGLFSRSEDGKKLTVIILNRHPRKRALVRVNFMNFPDMHPTEAKVLRAKNRFSVNTGDNPEAVFCKEIPMRNYKPMDHVTLDIGPIGIAMMTLTSKA